MVQPFAGSFANRLSGCGPQVTSHGCFPPFFPDDPRLDLGLAGEARELVRIDRIDEPRKGIPHEERLLLPVGPEETPRVEHALSLTWAP